MMDDEDLEEVIGNPEMLNQEWRSCLEQLLT